MISVMVDNDVKNVDVKRLWRSCKHYIWYLGSNIDCMLCSWYK